MNEKEVSEYLKQLNEDYLLLYQSDDYKLGRLLYNLKDKLSRREFSDIIRMIKAKNISRKIRNFSTKNPMKIETYERTYSGRIAVYMAIFGSYDIPYEPFVIDSRCDYYLITDQKISAQSVWKNVSESVYSLTSELDSLQKNRYYKIHPHQIFPQYDYTIYLDGNIEIMGYISELVKYINEKTGIALHNMSNRDCVYDEEKACLLLGKGNPDGIHKQLERYRKANFPKHFGMYECPIIVRDNSKMCKSIMEQWWSEFIIGARRDQISLPFIIWNMGLKFNDVGFLGNNVRTNPYFRVHSHL